MSQITDGHPAPDGFYRTMGEWVAYHLARGRSMDGLFQEYYADHESDFALPIGLDQPAPWEFREKPFTSHPSPFVGIIPDGRLWGTKGAVVTPENKLVWDVSVEHSSEPPEQHSVFRQSSLPAPQHYDETWAVLTYTASDSYFHWMLDVLPRLDLIRKSGLSIDRYVFNYMSIPILPFQDETLNMLGIPAGKRFQPQADSHCQIKQAVIPSLIGYTSHYPKWAVDFLRKELLPSSIGQTAPSKEASESFRPGPSGALNHKRIYVSRADAFHRRVSNEQQIVSLLGSHGFVTITPSEYSVSEQIRLFASADVIISPHGANLTNIVFCKPGTLVIELFSPGYVNPIYWALSNHAQLRYAYLIGSGRRSPESVHELRGKEDLTIPPDSLQKLLSLLGVV
ncbi:glycosyltransferase family 61 protein [Brevibacillus sp. FSL L8-0520]|uniref:glycosyltransferase family 61 protein n=1 Tax=Brevibacillus TaxID=55080 RepID=UPI00046ADE15|nr:glycosyltransferase family 61 protein [Brevibacillus borstelensis]MCM3558005.1 glycosyltransferase family 61 protein [Brevibacillus borstelensis]MED1854307.1 glycosyltransferase family 61 protein [Brevibacillus borstelensis]